MKALRRAYFDTSVLVKRYVREGGSVQAQRLFASRSIVSSVLSPVEVASAVRRRQEAGDLTEKQADTILADLRHARAGWDLVAVSRPVTDRAEEVIRTTRLRTLDAIHLSSALLFQDTAGASLPFVTADEAQAEAARLLGLRVVRIGQVR